MQDLCTHQRACPFFCKGRSPRVSLHQGRRTSAQAKSSRNGRSQAVAVGARGREVSVQAAGYLIVLGLPPLRPFPSALPSSRLQWEVSKGRAGPSLYHYPSITCHPPTLCWQQNFPPCPFSLRSHHWFRPSWSLTPWLFASFMIFTSFYSPSVPQLTPRFAFLFCRFSLFQLCGIVRCHFFFHTSSGFCHFEPFVEAAADLWIAREAPHTHRCLCRPIPFIRTTLSNFQPEGGLMCVRNAV